MIVKLKHEDVKGNTLRVEINGKSTFAYMRVATNPDNIVEALTTHGINRNVIAFDYVGDVQTLNTLKIGKTPVIIQFVLDTIDSTVDDIMESINNSKIRVVIKLPSEYADMQTIEEYSLKYPNLRFCGGHFLRIDTCNIGCVSFSDLPKSAGKNKARLVCQGCSCADDTYDINEFDIVEFTNEEVVVKEVKAKSNTQDSVPKTPKSPKAPAKKKAVSSILALAKEKGVKF
jgi:hypothetical protein